jgi:DNA-binding NtrC family response regulator
VPEADRPLFCFHCGQTFAASFFNETIHPVLQVALAGGGDFPAAVEAMVACYLRRYTGARYLLEGERRPEGIRFRVRWSAPAAARAYLGQYGLDPETCLRDSVGFIAGAVEGFAKCIIDGYTEDRFSWSADADGGTLDVALPPGGRFAYDRLLRTLTASIDDIETARSSARETESLENDLIVASPVMRRTWELMRRASRSDDLVLLRGESGTGKSVLARKIHGFSRRRDGPFVEVALTSEVGSENLVQSDLFGHEKGAFTGAADQKQGLFSLADGGTIFLDEVGDAPPELQAKLLRVLETSTFKRLGGVRDIRVDVRVIAATNRDLERLIREGAFREDLYYRLSVIPIRLPPLRERSAEVPALAEFLLACACERGRGPRRLVPGVAGRLAAYPWPGNVRELDHALKYASAMAEGEAIGIGDFPEPLGTALRGSPPAPAAPAAQSPPGVVDPAALRSALRTGFPPTGGRRSTHHGDPRHIDYAKRVWLATLIDEFGGDLTMAVRFWDRSSEKTLRALVKAYGLSEELAAARVRGPRGPA